MPTPDPDDEGRHAPDSPALWNESYYLDWFTEDGSLGGYLRIGFNPNLGTVWYWACLVGEDRPLVTVIEHDVALPASATTLELRHEGLWADHAVEAPLEHLSANLEAFAVALDDPADVYGDAHGERVPFGFELDWYTDRAAYQWPPVTPRYEIPCRVQGRVLVGREEIEVDGWGQRDHSWGAARDWWSMGWSWSAGRLEDGTRFHGAGGFFPGDDWGVAYALAPGSTEFVEGDRVGVETDLGRQGLPERARLTYCGLDLEVDPVAFAPVLLVAPDGRASRFPRALCRFRAADGRGGVGWVEWNQPPTS
jgi:hypothetical protein